MSRRKKRKKLTFFSKLLIFIIIGFIGVFCYKKYVDYNDEQMRLEALRIEKVEKEKKQRYEKCLVKKFENDELNDEVDNLVSELNDIVKKYNVYVYYEDITSGFDFKYREKEVVYGASLIKLVDALYLYDKNVDFNDTMTYTSKYIKGSSKGMANHNLGEDITILNLMKYSLSVSDNSAHVMLVDYIGYNNLRDYGKSLGATEILTGVGNEKYGNQTANDTNIYLKRAYEIMTNHENGIYLKEYMTNDYQNHLLLDNNINVAHKYGSYSNYFHNIGIVFDEYPYTISILTQHGSGKYKEIIKEIHTKVNEIHTKFRYNRMVSCYENSYE